MNLFTIKDLESLSGIKAHTIRIWEQRYNFLKPNRTFTNIRYYNNEELKTVLNIALLNKYGFKISHIDKMTAGQIQEKILSLTNVDAQQDRIVYLLIQHMIEVDMDQFESVLDTYILSRGIERTLTQIIFPFTEKIGTLWVTNHINPAQEHLVSNIIRQRLIVGIAGLSNPYQVKKAVLLFLPEGEYHELGLLFMHFLLKNRGIAVIYAGSNVPLQDLEYLAKIKKPDYLYSHITTVGQAFNFEKFLVNISQKFPDIPIVISGLLTQTYSKQVPPPVAFKKTFAEAMAFVSSIM